MKKKRRKNIEEKRFRKKIKEKEKRECRKLEKDICLKLLIEMRTGRFDRKEER